METRTDKFILKLYRLLNLLFLTLFVSELFVLLYDPNHLTIIKALGYLLVANQNLMLYNQKVNASKKCENITND